MAPQPTEARGTRLLIGYDGSDSARAAILDLSRAALGPAGEVMLVSVADVAVPATPPMMAPFGGEGIGTWETSAGVYEAARVAAEARAERHAREGADIAAEALPAGWRVQCRTIVDSAYAGLVRAAETWPADLMLVGSHGRSAIGRVLLGSVSTHVLTHAPCSVRIGRPRAERVSSRPPAGGESLRILVGVDGSDGGRAALAAVRRRHWPAGTEIRVLTAVDERLSTTFAAYAAWLVDRGPRLSGIRQALDAVVDDLHADGIKGSAAVLEGDPKQCLVDVAGDWGADCIFVGAKGHSRLERFLLGSVSAAVAARAPCSVEVVR